ncbi:MAG: tetratricopeptide repeat protein [Chthoniobacterales bacterium]
MRHQVGLALRRQNYEKAATLARQAIDLAPHNEGNWDRLVQAYFGLADLAGVRRALASWRVAVEKPSPKVDNYAGDLALASGDPAAAIEFWSKVLRARPKNERVLEKLARAQSQARSWTEEQKTWSRLIALHDSATFRVQRALCLRRMHHWEDALADVHRAQELSSDDPEVLRAGKLFEHLPKFLAEIRELDARLVLSPSDAELLADRALLFLRADDPDLAADDADAAARLQPSGVRPILFKAIAMLALNRPADCEKLGVQTFIRLDTLQPEFLETISRLDSQISAEQNNPDLYATRAWQLNDIAEPALALRDADKAAELDPKSGSAQAEASYALMKLGREEEACDRIKKATDADPNSSTAWQYRGELEMHRGDHVAAVESLTRALSINETATALQRREECYRRLGLLVKADQDHRAIEELNARGVK